MKKKYIILLICLVLLIGVVGFVIGRKGDTPSSTAPQITAKVIDTTKPSPGFTKVNLTNDASYKDSSGYTLYYPKSWTEEKSDMSNKKGTIFLLQPQNPSTATNPHITVAVVDAKRSSLADLTSEFGIFGYKKATEVIGGNTAIKYQRPLPTPQGTLHSTAYIYEKKGTIYLFKLGYKQDAVDQQLEDEFTQIATNFSSR